MRRSAMLPLLALLALPACTRDASTTAVAEEKAPTDAGPAAAAADGTASLTVPAVADLQNALSDVTTRLLPGLQDQNAAAQLGSHLSALAQQVDVGNIAEARIALAAADAELAASVLKAAESADAADLSFIQLTLDQARLMLHGDATARAAN